MSFVECLLDMQAASGDIDLNRLRRWLEERGITAPRGGMHMSTLRLWLKKVGVFVARCRVDEARLLNSDVLVEGGMASFGTSRRSD